MRKLFSIIICVICFVMCGCRINVSANTITGCDIDNNYGFVIETEDILFYYQIKNANVGLWFLNLQTGEKKFIDEISSEFAYTDVSPMFLIEDRIYYSRCKNKGYTAEIVSLDIKDLTTRLEGSIVSINEKALFSETSVGEIYAANAFKIFKYNNSIYVLIADSVYKLDSKTTKPAYEHISSMYIADTFIYYSTYKSGVGSGVFCYDINTEEVKEIIPAEAIAKLNNEQITRHISFNVRVLNIAADSENIFFNGTSSATAIYKYNLKSGVLKVLDESMHITEKFKKYNGRIFYVSALTRELYGYDLQDAECFIVTNAHILSYNFYGDNLYFYKITDYDNFSVALQRYNVKTKEVSSISANGG